MSSFPVAHKAPHFTTRDQALTYLETLKRTDMLDAAKSRIDANRDVLDAVAQVNPFAVKPGAMRDAAPEVRELSLERYACSAA